MMVWKRFCDKPTESSLQDYPTILDVLKYIIAEEEQVAKFDMPLNTSKTVLDKFREKGHYFMLIHASSPVLHPTGRMQWVYYRGQSKFYEPCHPSIYRNSGLKLEEETLRSYFQTAEMVLVLKTHPVISYIENVGICNDVIGMLPLTVMYEGLAQHYGIKTKYLDLTNDIWAAAFFATTEFDGKVYHPKYVKEGMDLIEKFGVMYRLNYMTGDTSIDSHKDEILPIGLQYFNRPGRQSGLVRNMDDVHDLHKVPHLDRVFFRHENEASKLMFTMSQFGKKFMSEDCLVSIVEDICADDVFCEKTIPLVRNNYFQFLPENAVKQMALDYGFQFVDRLKTGFDNEDVEKEYREWHNGGAQRYMNSILMMPVTSSVLDD